MRHFQDIHGDVIKCSHCQYELPGSRKYLMAHHFERRHPGQKVSYSFTSRSATENRSPSPVFPEYHPKQISRCRSPVSSRKSTTNSKSPPKTKSHSRPRPKEQTDMPEKEACPPTLSTGTHPELTPLRSPSLSVSLRSSPAPISLYGLDPDTVTSPLLSMPVIFEPPRKVVRKTPDAVPDATAMSESASVPQLCSPETSAILSLFEAQIPNLSPLKDSELDHRCPIEVLPATEKLEGVLPTATLEPGPAVVPETSLPKSVDTFSSAPQYVLHKCETTSPTDVSSTHAHDPRLFFAGAPSSTRNDFVACLLRRANIEARRSSGRTVSWVPSGAASITKVEELTFPDGRVYRLKSIFTPDPEYTLTAEACSQTSPACQQQVFPDKKDMATQVSTKQTYTLE